MNSDRKMEISDESSPFGWWLGLAIAGIGFVLLPGETFAYIGGVLIGISLAVSK